ncbi:hypothetical protein M413DRAFT_369676 [Hebeloma cylindrosporum]|uniref:Uncharacterized protein n=1 Tax=Hebeloma cylindrosporum TaxID=76867 RepID=A0A0C3BSK9_HEBCY|nr:hypothetical protein M413DRAFT_369676 [Hebeloma cylindrosporum h7]
MQWATAMLMHCLRPLSMYPFRPTSTAEAPSFADSVSRSCLSIRVVVWSSPFINLLVSFCTIVCHPIGGPPSISDLFPSR